MSGPSHLVSRAGLKLRPRLAGLLCYALGPLMWAARPAHPRIRFHAVQASLAAAVVAMFNLALSIIQATVCRHDLLWCRRVEAASWCVYSVELVLWAVTAYLGYQLADFQLPGIGKTAQRLARTASEDLASAYRRR